MAGLVICASPVASPPYSTSRLSEILETSGLFITRRQRFQKTRNTGLHSVSQTWLCKGPGVGLSPVVLTNSIPGFWNHQSSLKAVADLQDSGSARFPFFPAPPNPAKWHHCNKGRRGVEPGSPHQRFPGEGGSKARVNYFVSVRSTSTSLMPGI